MRQIAVLAAMAMLVAACSGVSDVRVSGEPVASTQANQRDTPTSTPGTAPSTPGTAPLRDPEPTTPELRERSEYLLTENDLPGWQYVRSMDFSAERTFESSDCELMNQAWGAHALPGTRIRAGSDAVNLRQVVVEMPDAASAGAVLDAADRVWHECVMFDVNGGTWWVEPIEMPNSGEWRTSAIAIGVDDSSVWIIGLWQLDTRVVFVDIDGEHPWDRADLILRAVAGRLTGAPAPTPDLPELVEPGRAPEPLPTTTPRPDWSDDALALLIPDAGEIGPGWEIDGGNTVAPEPGGGQEIPGCDIPSPVTPPGIEVTFERGQIESIEVQLMSGTADEAAAWPPSFRALAGCDLSESGFVEMVDLEADVNGADDAVVLEARLDLEGIPGAADAGLPSDAFFAVASFDGLIIGVLWVDEEDGASVDDVTELIELIASKR